MTSQECLTVCCRRGKCHSWSSHPKSLQCFPLYLLG
uniref:Uncharacterized protein n=1 Tax=Rhizophora mucronata TaxID=61149 RepID=A0A2P2R1N5_RHIMU